MLLANPRRRAEACRGPAVACPWKLKGSGYKPRLGRSLPVHSRPFRSARLLAPTDGRRRRGLATTRCRVPLPKLRGKRGRHCAGASPKRYTAHRSDALDDERRQWTSPSDFRELLEELPRDGLSSRWWRERWRDSVRLRWYSSNRPGEDGHRGRDSTPRYGVGDNLNRHATLQANTVNLRGLGAPATGRDEALTVDAGVSDGCRIGHGVVTN